MSIISTSIVSALNNYNSIVPIVTKDLVENCGRTAMAYHNAGKETKKYEATETFIEANATSLLWYGAIPTIKGLFNLTAFKLLKLNPNVSLELLEQANKFQNIEEINKKIDLGELPKQMQVKKGILGKKTELVDTKALLTNLQKNAGKYKSLHIARTIVSTAVPVVLSAWILPKAIIAYTQHTVDKANAKKQQKIGTKTSNTVSMTGLQNNSVNSFLNQLNQKTKSKAVAFSGLSTMLLGKATEAQKSLLGDMVAVDLAISGSRVYYANKREQEALNGKKAKAPYAAATEKIIREGGFLYLIYYGGKHIKNSIDKLTKNKFDPIVLESKEFVSELKNGKFAKSPLAEIMPLYEQIDAIKTANKKAFWKNPIKGLMNLKQTKAQEKNAIAQIQAQIEEKTPAILKYIDNNINSDSDVFLKYAKQLKWIKTVKNEAGQTFRNPLVYLDLKELGENFANMSESASDFLKTGKDNLETFVKHKIKTKRIGVYGNLIASSFAVCYVLPKIVYTFRKWYTGSSEEPGISQVIHKNDK